MAKDFIYSDFTAAFSQHPVRQDLSVLTDSSSVKQSIKNLILTDFYERPFEPQKGCGIRGLLFEPISETVAEAIQKSIESTIKNWEGGRVNLISVEVKEYPDDNAYKIEISFTISTTEVPITLSFMLYRVR